MVNHRAQYFFLALFISIAPLIVMLSGSREVWNQIIIFIPWMLSFMMMATSGLFCWLAADVYLRKIRIAKLNERFRHVYWSDKGSSMNRIVYTGYMRVLRPSDSQSRGTDTTEFEDDVSLASAGCQTSLPRTKTF